MAYKKLSNEMPDVAEDISLLEETQTMLGFKIERQRHKECMKTLLLIASSAFNAICVVILIWMIITRQSGSYHHEIYSPLQKIVKYFDTTFYDNVFHLSPFQGPPNDERDTLWDELYRRNQALFKKLQTHANNGVDTSATIIAAEDAKKLANRTMIVPGTNGDGIIQLEVFHQLHCLNALRKSLYPDRFPDYSVFFLNGTRNPGLSIHHDHCIDRIRQGLMCASNLGSLVYRWSDIKGQWVVNMESRHTCKNFEDIRRWAVSRALRDWDTTAPSDLTGQ